MSLLKRFARVCLVSAAFMSATAMATGTVITFNPVDFYSGTPFVNDNSYGAVQFFAIDPDGATLYPDDKNQYVVSKPGTYRITGASVYNFCYPTSVNVEVNERIRSITVDLPVGCE